MINYTAQKQAKKQYAAYELYMKACIACGKEFKSFVEWLKK